MFGKDNSNAFVNNDEDDSKVDTEDSRFDNSFNEDDDEDNV